MIKVIIQELEVRPLNVAIDSGVLCLCSDDRVLAIDIHTIRCGRFHTFLNSDIKRINFADT